MGFRPAFRSSANSALIASRSDSVRKRRHAARESGSGTREFAEEYFVENGVRADSLNTVMELGSPEALKGLVATGVGFTIMSRATVNKEIRLGVLVALPLTPRLIRNLSVVYPKEKFRSRLVNTFVEFAKERLASKVTA